MSIRIEKGLYWDRAWKLVEGCTKVSPGCAHCWSERESAMRLFHPNPKISEKFDGVLAGGKWNGKIKLREDNLNLPLKIKKPTRFAIWNDLFHEDVTHEFQYKTFKTILKNPQHTFLILTKRPEIMAYHFETLDEGEFPKNMWFGVTAENQEQADKRIPILMQIPAAVRFVSVEPMLERIDLKLGGCNHCQRFGEHLAADHHWKQPCSLCGRIRNKNVDWIAIGAESGLKPRKIDNSHILDLLLQCSDANVPAFLKQAWINGKLVKMPKLGGEIWDQMPNGLDKNKTK